MHLRDPSGRFALLRTTRPIAFIPAERPAETPLEITSRAGDAKVVHALSGSPGVDIRLGNGGLGPLFFTAAVIAAMHHGEDHGEGGETDDQDDKHDDPFPVSGEPARPEC